MNIGSNGTLMHLHTVVWSYFQKEISTAANISARRHALCRCQARSQDTVGRIRPDLMSKLRNLESALMEKDHFNLPKSC
jgi:hypothetical protein